MSLKQKIEYKSAYLIPTLSCIDMNNSSVIPLQRHFRGAYNHTSVLNTSEHVSVFRGRVVAPS